MKKKRKIVFVVILVLIIMGGTFGYIYLNKNKKKNTTIKNDNKEYYQFETFEGDTYRMSYNDFLDIVKLAIIRFYLGTDDVEIKESLKEYIKNTVFDSVLDNIDSSLASGVPLVYGQ